MYKKIKIFSVSENIRKNIIDNEQIINYYSMPFTRKYKIKKSKLHHQIKQNKCDVLSEITHLIKLYKSVNYNNKSKYSYILDYIKNNSKNIELLVEKTYTPVNDNDERGIDTKYFYGTITADYYIIFDTQEEAMMFKMMLP